MKIESTYFPLATFTESKTAQQETVKQTENHLRF